MAGSSLTGFARLGPAVRHSWAGLVAAWQHESAFRQELSCLLLALPLAYWIADSLLEWLLLVGVVVAVLVVELMNTAVESVVDRVGLERHELSGRAKDQGSAAVFVAVLFAAVVWCCLLVW